MVMRSKQPMVCICTMSHNPLNRAHSVCNALTQSYHPKTLFIIDQDTFKGDAKTIMLDKSLNLEVYQTSIFVNGKDPTWWYRKLEAFLEVVRQVFPKCDPLCAIMDEDDRFANDYLEVASNPITRAGYKVAWNFNNVMVTNEGFIKMPYREPVGTVIGYYSVFRYISDLAVKIYPDMINPNGKDPLDAKWRGLMQKHYNVASHDGVRYFFQWSGSSTRRKREQELDYDG